MKLMNPELLGEVFSRLKLMNPAPVTELKSTNPYTLLVAVVLSAQMTDRGVNRATESLFARVSTPCEMLALGEDGLKEYIKSVNLYPTKARHIIALSRILVERFSSEVPSTREELESLPGVGRKTANVILNVVFSQATMPVDTHITRISHRMGLSLAHTPLGIEEDLLRLIPSEYARDAHHWLLLHGRYVCKARTPLCGECTLSDICPKNEVE